jgi:hypothetical protein
MNLKLGVSRKEGTPSYGSNGASAEIEIELDPDFSVEMVSQASALWHQALTAAVDSQLARMRTAPRPEPRPEPEPPFIPRRQRNDQPAPRPERPIDPNRLRNDGGPWRGAGPPATGRELLGWARKHGQDKAVFELGKAWDLPDRVIDWDPRDVSEVYDTLNSANGRS